VRVAVTLEQCWHRVPGGTAVAALAVTARLVDRVDQVGLACRHSAVPPDPYRPAIPVVHLRMSRLATYEGWAFAGRPRIERASGPVDLVHATTVMYPASRAPVVTTLHDLAFLHEPAHFTRHGARIMRRHLALVRDRAALVLCSSRATLDDCAAYGIDGDRLRHVPLGVDSPSVDAALVRSVRERYGLTRPYALFVGTLEPRKNLLGLMVSFEQFPHRDLELVVVGPDGWGDQLGPLASRVGARLLGFVPEVDKHALLAGAEVFCYPSLREGFGLPVLEAMAQGTPVVTSRGTSTEEVAGGAAALVDPLSPEAIAHGVADALDRRDTLVASGRRRAAEMTWARTADLTLAAYREVLS
jgi:glycosyltransferase involved in cell wall biosynthesis